MYDANYKVIFTTGYHIESEYWRNQKGFTLQKIELDKNERIIGVRLHDKKNKNGQNSNV